MSSLLAEWARFLPNALGSCRMGSLIAEWARAEWAREKKTADFKKNCQHFQVFSCWELNTRK
jgi:hypothetical protein